MGNSAFSSMFISFEGPEGAGKSTLIRTLRDRLTSKGLTVVTTREPGDGELGQAIRVLLLNSENMNPRSELFLFLADRANHVDTVIRPALAAGSVVLCDRYADSTIVYQGLGRRFDLAFLDSANEFATAGLRPDLTILLDVPAEVGLARVKTKDRLDREPLEFHQRIREGFLKLAAREPHRWRTIDARQSPEDVADAAFAIVWAALPHTKPEL
jgi:dTMP kinase